MKILKLTLRVPYPAVSGAQLRDYNLIRHLGQRHEVALFSFVVHPPPLADLAHMREFCREIYTTRGGQKSVRAGLRNLVEPVPYHVTSFRSRAMHEAVTQYLAQHEVDVIDASVIQLTQYFPRSTRAVTVLDQQNADRMVWSRIAHHHPHLAMRLIGAVNLLKMKAYEARIYAALDMAVSVSEQDLAITRSFAPEQVALHLAPNGVDTTYFAPQPDLAENEDALLICGGLNQEATVDAVLYFVHEMWPTIRQARPATQLWLVGRSPAPAIQALHGQNEITVHGSVPDVRPYHAQAAITLAPYRLGGGTKLKVLNALAMGRPVVATSVGAQGLKLDPRAICIADTPAAMVAAVQELLADAARRQEIGAHARREMVTKYDWDGIATGYERALQEAVLRKHAPLPAGQAAYGTQVVR